MVTGLFYDSTATLFAVDEDDDVGDKETGFFKGLNGFEGAAAFGDEVFYDDDFIAGIIEAFDDTAGAVGLDFFAGEDEGAIDEEGDGRADCQSAIGDGREVVEGKGLEQAGISPGNQFEEGWAGDDTAKIDVNR